MSRQSELVADSMIGGYSNVVLTKERRSSSKDKKWNEIPTAALVTTPSNKSNANVYMHDDNITKPSLVYGRRSYTSENGISINAAGGAGTSIEMKEDNMGITPPHNKEDIHTNNKIPPLSRLITSFKVAKKG